LSWAAAAVSKRHHTAVDAQRRAGDVAILVMAILRTAATDVAALLATIIELTVDTGAENHMEDR
jgi:hypothetical protein